MLNYFGQMSRPKCQKTSIERAIYRYLAPGESGGVARSGARLPYIYSMDPFELISTPYVDSRQCGDLLSQEN